MKRTWVTLGIVAMVVLVMALSVGTALAQGPNPGGSRTCTYICTRTLQSGTQLQTGTQQRIMTCTPQPQGTQLQTRTQQRIMTRTPQAQGKQVRNGAK